MKWKILPSRARRSAHLDFASCLAVRFCLSVRRLPLRMHGRCVSLVGLVCLAAPHAYAQTPPTTEPAEGAAHIEPTSEPGEPPPLSQAADVPSGPPAEEPRESAASGGLGLTPGTLQTGNLVIGRASEPEAAQPSSDDWQFTFHGYMRVPLRLGLGNEAGDTKLHVPPQAPDTAYSDYRYTNNLGGTWVELQFHYGNARAAAHVVLGAYSLSEAAYRDLLAQMGITQAFVTLNFPRAFGRLGGVTWNVGGFINSYGAAGRYDAGRYDTCLIGRTHIAGETMTASFALARGLDLTLEHGFGARLQAQPFYRATVELPPYLPYAGDPKYGQQATTLVHHAHAGLSFGREVTVAAHYLTTWSDDAKAEEKDGRITVYGVDLKLTGSRVGDAYVGFARVSTRDIMRLGPSLEFLHSYAGYSVRDTFFPGSDTGTGTIESLLFQYTLSLGTLLRSSAAASGNGPDVVLGAFGTFSWVHSDERMNDAGIPLQIPKLKSKLGGDVTYTMLKWLGLSFRYDLVRPDTRDDATTFSMFSPKLIVRTDFVTHEQVVLQYSRYVNGSEVRPAWPYPNLTPDENVFAMTASMYW